jgi:hypothetical protein
MTSTTPEIEKDRAEIASEDGFTGTLPAFLDWLRDALVYGGIRVHDEAPNNYGHPVVKVETVTAGYSSDEHLLHRVSTSIFPQSSWVSSHRGGLVVYEFPLDWFTSADELVWLKPESDVFETVHRARRIRVHHANGGYFELSYDTGVELAFQESDRDINEPDGLLIVRPITLPLT